MIGLSSGFLGFLVSVKKTTNEYIENFKSGLDGWGWKIWKYKGSKYKLEIDSITVRESMLIYELLVSKIRAIKGSLVISQGSGKIKSVSLDSTGTNYTIYLEEGTHSLKRNDLIRCMTPEKSYWTRIKVLANDGAIVIGKSDLDEDGSGYPEVGDDIVQFGNTSSTSRQSLIYLHCDEGGQPTIDLLNGVNSKDLEGCIKVRIDDKGFYTENGEIKNINSNSEILYHLKKDGSAVLAKGNITWDTSGNVTFGSGVKLQWDNLSSQTQQNLKGEKGDDAVLPDWLDDYSGSTVIDGQRVMTPKIFAGTNDAGELNGIAIGNNIAGFNGLAAYGDSELKCSIDSYDGSMMIGGGFRRPFIDITETFNVDFEKGNCFYMNISNVADIAELEIDETYMNFKDGSQFTLVVYSNSPEASMNMTFTNYGDILESDDIMVSGKGLWTLQFTYCDLLPNIQMSKCGRY